MKRGAVVCRTRRGRALREKGGQGRALELLYETPMGRLLLKAAVRPAFSRAAGALLNSRLSACGVAPFIKKHGICMGDYGRKSYPSFNAFFCRDILPGRRPVAKGRDVLISPCDGKLLCCEIRGDSRFQVKRVSYTLESLLRSRSLAERYRGGLLLIFRLSVDDYHHFCYPADGKASKEVQIPGVLHTVHPAGAKNVRVYRENARQYGLLKTEAFGTVLMMEVGALLVGRIVSRNRTETESEVRKGAEKGHFEFGGSTVILCFQRGTLRPDRDILANSREGIETKVRMGEGIGRSII